MKRENIDQCESETFKACIKQQMEVTVSRENSAQVYQLLYELGFDCRSLSATRRKKAIEILMEENGGCVPSELEGLVEAQLVDELVVRKKLVRD